MTTPDLLLGLAAIGATAAALGAAAGAAAGYLALTAPTPTPTRIHAGIAWPLDRAPGIGATPTDGQAGRARALIAADRAEQARDDARRALAASRADLDSRHTLDDWYSRNGRAMLSVVLAAGAREGRL